MQMALYKDFRPSTFNPRDDDKLIMKQMDNGLGLVFFHKIQQRVHWGAPCSKTSRSRPSAGPL